MAAASPVLGLHLDHRAAPGEDEHLAKALAEILARPCFAPLTRVTAQFRDRDPSYQPTHPATIAGSLLAPAAIAAVLDCGRRRDEPIATARVSTGRWLPTPTGDMTPPCFVSTVVVPAPRADAPAIIDAFVDLAAALGALAGYIAVEPDHDRAHRAALAQTPSREDFRGYYRRAQERRAHSWYDRAVDAQLAGPEWGIFFGPRHLARLVPDPTCFPVIRDAGAAKLALLSESPADVLDHSVEPPFAPSFERQLDAARRALAPLLMDVSAVPVL